MFLIRTAFWLSLVILLLPAEEPARDGRQDVSLRSEVDAARFVAAARDTFSDISGLCQRNPEVCDVGGAALDTFVRKARYGANMVVRWLSDEAPPAATPAERTARADVPDAPAPVPQNTLTADDLKPAWRGPQTDRKI